MCFAAYLISPGFVEAKSDTSLHVCRGDDIIYLLLYMDDIVLTASATALLRHTITTLQQFSVRRTWMDEHHFLGMQVQSRANVLFLSQCQCMLEILDQHG